MIRINSVYVSQISPVGLCMQNSMIRTRNTGLHRSKPSSVAFECKTATFGSELQVSMGASLKFVAFACKTATFGPELQVSMGPRPHLLFFIFKTTTLAPVMQVSMGPSPHLWSLHAKQRLLDQNYKSLCVQYLTCRFVNAKQRD